MARDTKLIDIDAFTTGSWRWQDRVDEAGRHIATLLVTERKPVPFNDPVIFALREDWIGQQSPEREAAKKLITASPRLLESLLNALPYVEDVLSNPPQLACFKAGVVQRHANSIRAAIAAASLRPQEMKEDATSAESAVQVARERVVNALVEGQVNCYAGDSDCFKVHGSLSHLFRQGFQGFETMTIAELVGQAAGSILAKEDADAVDVLRAAAERHPNKLPEGG